MKKLTPFLVKSAFIITVLFSAAVRVSYAEESTKNKVKDKATDVKADSKIVYRHIKQKVRKAQGKDSILKDAKDLGHDVGDKMHASGEKARRNSKTK
jgi:hypothetical protein